ncbi:hypothetical protein Nepgr_014887 [Nepenthes gracilis]|uniref:Uncharacterized protein n=1 Tax=Nepenthes gracilis TaxID=150966 RepID=A0AAD3SML9_NEPGR|nr:hypothetical protein Nepgr_014887 [Nepenthes gracilis]
MHNPLFLLTQTPIVLWIGVSEFVVASRIESPSPHFIDENCGGDSDEGHLDKVEIDFLQTGMGKRISRFSGLTKGCYGCLVSDRQRKVGHPSPSVLLIGDETGIIIWTLVKACGSNA